MSKRILSKVALPKLSTPSMSRAIVRVMLPAYVKQGLNVTQTIAAMKIRGYTYSRTAMLSDYREAAARFKFSPRVIDFSNTRKPIRAIMSEVELSRARRYRVFANVKYVNSETGRVFYQDISFYDNTLRTKNQWAAEYLRQKQEASYAPELEVSEISIKEIQHQEGWTY